MQTLTDALTVAVSNWLTGVLGGKAMTIPYSAATSDMRAREEIKKILTRFGCESDRFHGRQRETRSSTGVHASRPSGPTNSVGKRLGADVVE